MSGGLMADEQNPQTGDVLTRSAELVGSAARRRARAPPRAGRAERARSADDYCWVPAGRAAGWPARVIALKRNLKVPCGCARNVISGPNANTLPAPTVASNATVPPSR